MSSYPFQLPFNFSIHHSASVEEYIVGENKEAVFQLFSPENNIIFIWGQGSVGKTHLLSSLISKTLESKQQAAFLPLSQYLDLDPIMLNNLEHNHLVCLDDIDTIAGDDDWEKALFHFYNKIKQEGNKLVVSGQSNALNTAFDLPDLKSRLQWGLTYELKPLNDDGIIQLLKQKALNQSFKLGDEVALYLLNQFSRDLDELLVLLEQLGQKSLSEHRKLTIPFVKKFMHN